MELRIFFFERYQSYRSAKLFSPGISSLLLPPHKRKMTGTIPRGRHPTFAPDDSSFVPKTCHRNASGPSGGVEALKVKQNNLGLPLSQIEPVEDKSNMSGVVQNVTFEHRENSSALGYLCAPTRVQSARGAGPDVVARRLASADNTDNSDSGKHLRASPL